MKQIIYSPTNLKNVRVVAGYTQKQAALQLGVSIQTITGYEQGVSDPPIKKLVRLGSLYGVSFIIFCPTHMSTNRLITNGEL